MRNSRWRREFPEGDPQLLLQFRLSQRRTQASTVLPSFFLLHRRIGGISPFLCFDPNCKDFVFSPFPGRIRNNPFVILPDPLMRIFFPASFFSQSDRYQIVALSSCANCSVLKALLPNADLLHQVHLPSNALSVIELMKPSKALKSVIMEEFVRVEGVLVELLSNGKSVELEVEREERVPIVASFVEKEGRELGDGECRRVKKVKESEFEVGEALVALPETKEGMEEEVMRRLRRSGFEDVCVEGSRFVVPSKRICIYQEGNRLVIESESKPDESVHKSIRSSLCTIWNVCIKHLFVHSFNDSINDSFIHSFTDSLIH